MHTRTHSYADYREPPWVEENRRYKFTSYYYRLLAARLSFVVIFENVIATITSLMRWIIPDVPQKLRQQMRQHNYLTNELILQQEFQRAKEISNEVQLQKKKFGKTASGKPRTSRGSIDSEGIHTVVGFVNGHMDAFDAEKERADLKSAVKMRTSAYNRRVRMAEAYPPIEDIESPSTVTITKTAFLSDDSNGSLYNTYLAETTSQEQLIGEKD